jgi:A/G-specific adenine glycosylase
MPDKRAGAQKTIPGAAALLGWYDRHRRQLPWRAKPGVHLDPYRIWLSEIMLQQTTVAAVADYYRKFLARWPSVESLAGAPLDDVLAAWAGLGYYARARNLHKAAKVVAHAHGGAFPRTAEELRALPGIGAYTAGAIAAIAFDAREAAIDANAERVVARLFAVEEPLPGAKKRLRELGQSLVPETRAGDFAQALMDLGATICTPRRPACKNCPWTDDCEASRRGIAELLPKKAGKAVRPLKRGAAFVAQDGKRAILLVRRPEHGLLGGMLEPPLGPWTVNFPSRAEAMLQAPFRSNWIKRAGIVRHGFTHFELEIEVYVAEVGERPKIRIYPSLEGGSKSSSSDSAETISGRGKGRGIHPSPNFSDTARRKNSASPSRGEAKWVPRAKLGDAALPTVMRKIIAHGLDDGGPLFAKQERREVVGAKRRSK